MGYDKKTKLITLDKVVIGGEEFSVTTREKEMLRQVEIEGEERLTKLKKENAKYNYPRNRYVFMCAPLH